MQNQTPPAAPPPYLSPTDINHLATNGHLALPLSPALASQYTQLFRSAKSFFALSLDEKQSLYPSPPQTTEQGYTSIPHEKEYLTIRHTPSQTSSITSPIPNDQLKSLWHNTAHLLHRVLADLSRLIDIDMHAWDPLLDGCLSLPETEDDATPSLLRVFRYEPGSGAAERHRDLGLLTLCVCAGRGLEVLDSGHDSETETSGFNGDGDEEIGTGIGWRDAPEVTLLVGDSLWLLSCGRVKAGVHRVVPNDEGRMSIVFALRMATRHEVDTRPFGGEEVVRSRDLWEKIWRSRVNVNAQRDVREEQKRRRRMRDVC
ncbi:hypothetical protein MBLNU457_7474t1 [Dothideomycetes sp. NU457]